ncbi:pilus assembly PilX N-terminal domain-containing protein [Cupriavidus sp. IDO]|uniref:pilus assembly PilX N-terminal domain-containing protein n=1 Tax=Cupriavidus sp. IDO TaxID=1539142 RepID=UPI0005792C41|nr:pilus assembly PilX N-terminal domain-containing protein [Cupriavidus sp. IDO]KWR89997.1 pilus assembly protein [Cupriavidus sp. IDO]
MKRTRHKQAGVTLIVTLIFLAMFMLIALAIVNSGLINVKVVANQQHTVEARDVAQQSIEQVISNDFTSAPASAAVALPVDVNADGKADYVAQVAAPACTSALPLKNTQLDLNDAGDVSCFIGSGSQNTGIITASTKDAGNSLCNATQWDVAATVNDSGVTNAAVTVHQGIGVRMPAGSVCP